MIWAALAELGIAMTLMSSGRLPEAVDLAMRAAQFFPKSEARSAVCDCRRLYCPDIDRAQGAGSSASHS
jgi:hypothetical protein